MHTLQEMLERTALEGAEWLYTLLTIPTLPISKFLEPAMVVP
jgi:hypothetical protein